MIGWQRRQIRQLERLVDDTHGKLEQLQLHFARFAPDDVVEQLTEHRGEVKASRRMVTVLFADLKGFTALCDRLDSEQMVPILNGYFRCMSQAITLHHGRVTELTGDGILALFGALEPNPWQAQDAVLGALAMREALGLQRDAAGTVAAGAGAGYRHPPRGGRGRGDGQRGAEQVRRGGRHDQRGRARGALDARSGGRLLITEEVRRELDGRFRIRAMPAQPVKGKPEPIVTYLVEGVAMAAQTA